MKFVHIHLQKGKNLYSHNHFSTVLMTRPRKNQGLGKLGIGQLSLLFQRFALARDKSNRNGKKQTVNELICFKIYTYAWYLTDD